MAIRKPVTVAPASRPTTPLKPRIIPTTMGVTTAMTVGSTISFRLALVHRSTQRA